MSDPIQYLIQSILDNKMIVIYIALASVAGIILSTVGLYKKFGPDFIRVVYSFSGLSYLALSAFGASFFALTLKDLGLNVITNSYLNGIILSLTGAGIFLGILTKIAVNEKTNDNLNSVKTLSDYIYDSLNDSMTRRIDLEKGDEVMDLVADYNLDSLIKPLPNARDKRGIIIQFIDTNSYLTDEKKKKLKQDIEDCVEDGNYALLLFKLTQSETNITIKRLKKYIEGAQIPKRRSKDANPKKTWWKFWI